MSRARRINRRLTAFLRQMRGHGETLAFKLVNEELDSGKSLDDVLMTEGLYGYYLQVKRLGAGAFRVDFGCLAGPDCGDGSAWTVHFEKDGRVDLSGPVEIRVH